MPRVKVCTNHYYFIFQVGARYLANNVMTQRVIIVKARNDIHFDFNRKATRQNADHAVVLLSGNDDLRDYLWLVQMPGLWPLVRGRVNRNGNCDSRDVNNSTITGVRLSGWAALSAAGIALGIAMSAANVDQNVVCKVPSVRTSVRHCELFR